MRTVLSVADKAHSLQQSQNIPHSLKGSCPSPPVVPNAIYACKLASETLQSPAAEDKELLPIIENALEFLHNPFKGTRSELEQLLQEASRLRRASAARITAIIDETRTNDSRKRHPVNLASACIRAIFEVTFFVARYIAFKPPTKGTTILPPKSTQRSDPVTSVAQLALKSTVAAVQVNLIHDFVDWTLCVTALDSCLTISDALKGTCEGISNTAVGKESIPTTTIRVSNVYWSRYLRRKDVDACPSDLLSALGRSIQALAGCTPSEKITGFLAVKCERAAALYIRQTQFEKARQVLEIALDAHVQAGTLSIVAQTVSSGCSQDCWGQIDSQQFLLGRLLSIYSRLLLQHQTGSASFRFYDGKKLKAEERGLILEKQFVASTETLVPESDYPRLRELAEIVLSLYRSDTWSMQRMKFVSRLLAFCAKISRHPRQLLPEPAVEICMNRPGEEYGFSEKSQCSQRRSLHLSVLLQWEFQTGKPPLELLHEFVVCHTTLVDSNDFPVHDLDLLIAQSRSVVDFTDMYGLAQLRLDALLLTKHLLELQSETDTAALSSCASQIGLQLTRMGLTKRAGRAFANAETLLGRSSSKTLIALQWHLAYSEYLIALSSYKKAADQLESAQRCYEADFTSDIENGSRSTRLVQHKYLAQAAYVASRLALENGDLDAAILHAKKSVKISVRQWAVLEKLLSVAASSPTRDENVSNVELLTEGLSDMTLSTERRSQNPLGRGAAFWAHVYSHFDALVHLSRLSAHRGSFQDGIYYAEQARKVGEAVQSDVLLCTASCQLALQQAEAGDLIESQVAIDHAQSRWNSMNDAAGIVQVLGAMAKARLARLESDQVKKVVGQARAAISKVQASDSTCQPSTVNESCPSRAKAASKAAETGHTRRTASNARTPRRPAIRTKSRAATAETQDASPGETVSPPGASLWFQRTQAEIDLLMSCLHIRLGSYEKAKGFLGQIPALGRSPDHEVWHCVQQASLMLVEATRLLQSDAVYSVLLESTIACPTGSGRQSLAPHKGDCERMSAEKRAPTKSTRCERKPAKNKPPGSVKLTRAGDLVSEARGLMVPLLSLLQTVSNSSTANEFSDLLIRLELLSSILLPATHPDPLRIASHLNTPKSFRWSREAASLQADAILSDKRYIFSWPETNHFARAASLARVSALDNASLQQQLIHNLPPSWSVVTVALCDDQTEMFISRLRSGQSPFLLRLPLHRSSSEDLSGTRLEFFTAKKDMVDIIAKANMTAHDTKDRSDKKGKKDWWAARKALDQRLMSLVKDMEAFWLGGFRGILSSCHADQRQLGRFSQSLLRILDQHLPSRRKMTTNAKSGGIQLHSHVVELFVALGDPDQTELDDLITDLLYFVIDVLQFQSEINAYDEVDFDVMVVEITDALRSYHDAAGTSTSEQEKGHTILIIDKALHAFPWESLPCLQGQSVSRMPSLNCLHDRLQRIKRQSGDATTKPGLHIDADEHGAYILNPSSDLTSTESTFAEPFRSTLKRYTSIVNRPPTETEFETCLRDKDLCLYFGHGSGGQFIRGRTIKRLQTCAVTFLMGCSSSKMVECGQFEPYGMPYNYLQAGSAAVVGTLWDVTDKDIDRFAMQTFIHWGLLTRDDTAAADGPKNQKARKGRNAPKTPKSDLRENEKTNHDVIGEYGQLPAAAGVAVGLDTAVSKARDACLLRYLNGAAPVIYGIPVYLNR